MLDIIKSFLVRSTYAQGRKISIDIILGGLNAEFTTLGNLFFLMRLIKFQ